MSAGRLSSGDELPPIRVLAESLVVNPNTIARAYRELEMAGVVEKRRTAGTYISAEGSRLARRERTKILSSRIGPNGFLFRGPYQTDPSTERSAPNFESKGTTP